MANTYDTSQYPLGSTEVKVLYNNASNLDDAVNSEAITWLDRFGKLRKSMAGIEADADNALLNTGFEFLGDYDSDGPLTLTRYNQTFSKDGEFWRPSPDLVLPFTTTGNWVADQSNFIMNGDASLRSALADATVATYGAAMIARSSQVVESIVALRGLSKASPSQFARTLGFDAAYPGFGSADYALDPSDTTTVEDLPFVVVATDGARWKLQHSGAVNIQQFGCLPIPGFDNFSRLQSGIASAWARRVQVVAGHGTYEYGTTLDLSYPTLVLRGSGFRNTVFKYTGINRAMRADGDRPNNGSYSFDIDLSDFTIEGNANVTDLLRVQINHPRIVRLNLREASTTIGCGLRIEGVVAGHFEQITCSTNTQLMTYRPHNGIYIDGNASLGGARATCNTLISPCLEGLSGDGLVLKACDMLTIVGGTSENNGANGLTEWAGCQMNTYIGFDCEVNLGFADLFIGGQNSYFINCGSTKYTYIDNSARSVKIEGGWFDKVEVGVGAVSVELSKLKTRFFGGPVGLITNNNPFLSTKDIFDVQANAFVFFAKPASLLGLTASPMTYTNNNVTSETILIAGGTVTQIAYIRIGTPYLMNPASGCVHLQPGDSIQINYTGSPTLTRVPGGANYQ